MSFQTREGFWREAFALYGSVTPHVMPSVLMFGLAASGICGISWLVERLFEVRVALAIAPFEFAGAALGLLLILRTNAGYDRWWEARKLWGGIVNQSRNLVIGAMTYGPNNSEWREKIVRWAAVFPHAARLSLRNELPSNEVANLVGPDDARRVASAEHMPSFVAALLGNLLHDARETSNMDGFAFIQVDRERALLIDHIGACERIAKTPLPRAYSINIRRFIVMFLLTLPLLLMDQLDHDWLVPFITMLVAYLLLSLDQIGVELENPFSTSNLSHLPLDDISVDIERDMLSLLKDHQGTRP
jgi:ion channel-forming bestrophin family protein